MYARMPPNLGYGLANSFGHGSMGGLGSIDPRQRAYMAPFDPRTNAEKDLDEAMDRARNSPALLGVIKILKREEETRLAMAQRAKRRRLMRRKIKMSGGTY